MKKQNINVMPSDAINGTVHFVIVYRGMTRFYHLLPSKLAISKQVKNATNESLLNLRNVMIHNGLSELTKEEYDISPGFQGYRSLLPSFLSSDIQGL